MSKKNTAENNAAEEVFLDLKAIDKFINYSDTNTINDTEVLDTYDVNENGEFLLSQRTINTKKISSNPQIDNIRYDLVKTLIVTVFDADMTTREQKVGFSVAFNTLKRAKMLKIR